MLEPGKTEAFTPVIEMETGNRCCRLLVLSINAVVVVVDSPIFKPVLCGH